MKENNLINEFQVAFGSRFIELRECLDNRYHLILIGEVFTLEDFNIINTRGFKYNIGFVSVSLKGHIQKELRIELQRMK